MRADHFSLQRFSHRNLFWARWSWAASRTGPSSALESPLYSWNFFFRKKVFKEGEKLRSVIIWWRKFFTKLESKSVKVFVSAVLVANALHAANIALRKTVWVRWWNTSCCRASELCIVDDHKNWIRAARCQELDNFTSVEIFDRNFIHRKQLVANLYSR